MQVNGLGIQSIELLNDGHSSCLCGISHVGTHPHIATCLKWSNNRQLSWHAVFKAKITFSFFFFFYFWGRTFHFSFLLFQQCVCQLVVLHTKNITLLLLGIISLFQLHCDTGNKPVFYYQSVFTKSPKVWRRPWISPFVMKLYHSWS